MASHQALVKRLLSSRVYTGSQQQKILHCEHRWRLSSGASNGSPTVTKTAWMLGFLMLRHLAPFRIGPNLGIRNLSGCGSLAYTTALLVFTPVVLQGGGIPSAGKAPEGQILQAFLM